MPMGISDQRRRYPNRAPATEYVEMLPASLSTVEVMRPGPRTARNRASRVQTWRPRRRARTTPSRHCSTFSFMATMFNCAYSSGFGSDLRSHARHYIVYRDYAHGPAAVVDH